ncbi:MAG: Asp-tRNA(Asn)/Glu-tRNA(Gln) amidotransferase subunit GatA [Gemmatimonadaceae bacterium]|nr:Asp-tRNA(Asn)/Glu-tRNA(Gln) amidotransferase subunit GatA [Gemmatimonadaceae bacterium]
MTDAVRQGRITSVALVDEALRRVDRDEYGPQGLHAILHVDAAHLRGVATAFDQRPVAERASLSLAGVPIAIKDNLATLDTPTTCGSKILEGYRSPYEATAVRRLREAGAVMFAKTNMDEFAMGSSTEHSAYGPTRNPIDRSRVPGGSSGGSAALVAAGVVPAALGSETGGSVRQPAAFCGIVGIKPTYGRVSRFGLVAYASSLDHVGVFGRRVADAAHVLSVIAGVDARDATSYVPATAPAIDLASLADVAAGDSTALRGIVIGRPVEYFPDSLDAQIRARCDRACELMRAAGADVRDVSLPHTDAAIPAYYIIAPAEASSNLARYDGVRYGARRDGVGVAGMYEATRSAGFGDEVVRRILLGTYVLSAGYYDAYYKRAQAVRAHITADFRRVFSSGVHALFTPTTPTTAFALGAVADPYEMYLSDIFTFTANLAGIPAMSLPIGRVDGLPVGGQLLAPHFDEAIMLRIASVLEHRLGAEAHQ